MDGEAAGLAAQVKELDQTVSTLEAQLEIISHL